MHVLTILDHPNPASFSAAVAQQCMDGARAAGHSVELADLHAEGFDPRWSMADIEREADATTLPDVAKEQERIARAVGRLGTITATPPFRCAPDTGRRAFR